MCGIAAILNIRKQTPELREKEAENGEVAVRKQGEGDKGTMKIEDFAKISQIICLQKNHRIFHLKDWFQCQGMLVFNCKSF